MGDVEFWKGELDNKLAQLKEEIDEAVSINLLECPICSRSSSMGRGSSRGRGRVVLVVVWVGVVV